jgi:hypothetical protein
VKIGEGGAESGEHEKSPRDNAGNNLTDPHVIKFDHEDGGSIFLRNAGI